MTKRVAIYTRVSTDGQTVSNQLRELRAVAKRHGWRVVKEFNDKGISGANGREKRPGFDALCTGAQSAFVLALRAPENALAEIVAASA